MEEEIKKQEEIYLNQIKELSETAERQKLEQERLFQEKKLREKLEQLENEKIKKRREFEIREKIEMQKIIDSQNKKDIKHDKEKLEKNLIILLRKLAKIKLMLIELKRDINLEAILQKNFMEKEEINSVPNIKIKIENYEENSVYYWDLETFHNRYDLTKDLFNKYMDEDYDINNLPKEDDPLWDEQDESLLGYAFFKLEPLGYLISTKNELSIINPYNGVLVELLEVEIIPHDEKNNEFDEVLESPYDLVGQNLLYKIKIIKVKNLNINFCKNLRIEYQSFYDRSINYTKIYNKDKEKNVEFDIGEEFEHKIEYLTKEDIDFLEKENIKFKIYACEDAVKKDTDTINFEEKEIDEDFEFYDDIVMTEEKILYNKNKINVEGNKINEELDEPKDFIKKDDRINIIDNYLDDKNQNFINEGNETQKINNLNKDKDCKVI